MSKTGSMDCPRCNVWIAECQCDAHLPSPNDCEIIFDEGEKIDAIMREMTEEQLQAMMAEGSEHWATFIPTETEEIPF
jgi:hypothetical protein